MVTPIGTLLRDYQIALTDASLVTSYQQVQLEIRVTQLREEREQKDGWVGTREEGGGKWNN